MQITTLMAQTNYKNVEEAKGLEVGDIVENFIALDQHDQDHQFSIYIIFILSINNNLPGVYLYFFIKPIDRVHFLKYLHQ